MGCIRYMVVGALLKTLLKTLFCQTRMAVGRKSGLAVGRHVSMRKPGMEPASKLHVSLLVIWSIPPYFRLDAKGTFTGTRASMKGHFQMKVLSWIWPLLYSGRGLSFVYGVLVMYLRLPGQGPDCEPCTY